VSTGNGHACAAGFVAGRPRHRSRGAEANGRLRARAGRAYEVAKGGAHAGAHVCAEHWATGRLVLDGDAVTPGGWLARATCGPTFQWVGLWAHGLVGAVHPIDDRTDHWKLKLNFVVEDHGRPRSLYLPSPEKRPHLDQSPIARSSLSSRHPRKEGRNVHFTGSISFLTRAHGLEGY